MTMQEIELQELLEYLVRSTKETEWLEFKLSNSDPDGIGQRISAIANTAALHDMPKGYLVYGVEDGSHTITGEMV